MTIMNEHTGDVINALERIRVNLSVENLEQAKRFPRYFQIETTRLCNSRCPFCPSATWDKSTPFMPDDLYAKIVEEFKDHADWIRVVTIQRAGEPLLDKKLARRVRMMKDAGVKMVNISTNGSLLNEDAARALLDAGIDEVMFSIDSIDPLRFEALRVGLRFHQVMDNAMGFMRLRDKMNPLCAVRVRGVACFDWRTPEGMEELRRWEEHWQPLLRQGDRVYMKKLDSWGDTHVWNEVKDYYNVHETIEPCIVPWSTLHVTTKGIVPMCGHDIDAQTPMGDVNIQSIRDIWQGEGFERLRAIHGSGRRQSIGICVHCHAFDDSSSLEPE